MITAKTLATCLMLAAQQYGVPEAVMIGVLQVEGGRVGQEVRSPVNGTYDLGPMQINTIWMPQLARTWKTDVRNARRIVRDDGCVNMFVAAWILRQKIQEGGSLYAGIARYHSGTPWLGRRYAAKVINAMQRRGLIRTDVASAQGPYAKRDGQPYYLAQR